MARMPGIAGLAMQDVAINAQAKANAGAPGDVDGIGRCDTERALAVQRGDTVIRNTH